MGATPRWKVYSKGRYVASCVEIEDAAMLVAFYGNGATIRDGHRLKDVVWKEGFELHTASGAYAFVAETITQRRPVEKS